MKNLPNSELKKLNKAALIEMDQAVQNDDQEAAHANADSVLTGLLLDLGFTDLVDRYHEVDKWYA